MKFFPPSYLIEEGFIHVSEDNGLRLFNYTQKTQFEKHWNEWTSLARGIVVDELDTVVARPFPKFFNWEELETKPAWPPLHIMEKMDGSLGIVYRHKGTWRVNTRGSFKSEQAIKAQEMLENVYKTNFEALAEQSGAPYTHLFEIIYPENRIVVDYGGEEKLVYLGSIDNQTGDYTQLDPKGFPTPKTYKADSLQELLANEEKNAEGFVLTWSSGFRCKIKFEEYKRLHRLMTQVTARTVWEHLSSENDIEELVRDVPDEFFVFIREIEAQIVGNVSLLEQDSEFLYEDIINDMKNAQEWVEDPKARKAFYAARVKAVQRKEMIPALFDLYEDRSPYQYFLRLCKPASGILPFKTA